MLATSALALVLPAAGSAQAQDATWLANPGSGDYNSGTNWTPGTVPTGTAFFDTSATTALSVSAATSVDSWTFNAGASNYTFAMTAATTFTGTGIVINGGSATLTNSDSLQFQNTSTAGSAAIINNFFLDFWNTATAGSATITNSYVVNFNGASTAGGASIVNDAYVYFKQTSTAGNAGITNNSLGTIEFRNSSNAGSAAIVNAGIVDFSGSAGSNNDNKVSAGSIAGSGTFNLGANELTVGSNNQSTVVSGTIADGGAFGGTGGSLVKTGTGTLTLSGANTYTGGTTVNSGTLQLGDAGGVGSVLGAVGVGSGATFEVVNADTSGITSITNSGNAYFRNSTSAGSATITNTYILIFYGASTAGSATITNNNSMSFFDNSTAGSADITNNYSLTFWGNSTVGSATITNIYALSLRDTATAGSATIANDSGGFFGFYDSSSAGSAGITNSGSMWFNNGSNAGSASIANNGTLTFYDATTADSATITNSNGRTTEFRGNSTAGNAQLINNGAAAVFDFSASTGPNGDNKLSAGSIAGNGTFNLGANELTVGGNNLSSTVSGVISGAGGSLVKTGTGTMTLTGTNTYTGGTTLSGGTVSASSNANLGDVAGSLTFNGGTLQVTGTTFTSTARTINWGAGGGTFDIADAANSFSVTQGLTGTGGLTKTGAGTLILSGTNTYTGATTVSAGTLNIQDSIASSTVTNNATLVYSSNATAGSASITNNGTGRIEFRNSGTAGSATITNNWAIHLFDASSASNATIINNEYIEFHDNSTAGSATISNNRDLYFSDFGTAGSATINNRGSVGLINRTTAGNAQLINDGAASQIDFSGSVGTNFDNKLSAGSIAGDGTFNLGANELTVGGNNLSTVVTGVIADGGAWGGTGASLIKTGTGMMTLSGTNTYTGATLVDGGTLAVNGSIAASNGVTVNSGGTLGGTGTVGNTTVASGGSLAPGNSIGTLTVQGNLTFNAGGVYMVEVSPTAADRTNVTGAATLTGATVQAIALPGSFRGQTYTLLNATGGLGGTQFTGLTLTGSSISPGARNPHLTYDANNVYLVLDPGTLLLPSGASGNQAGVAGAINKFVESGGAPPAAFDVLLNMSGVQLTNALNQVSGQPAGGSASAGTQMTTSFMTMMLNPFSGGGTNTGGGALGYARGFGAGDTPKAAEAYAAVTPKDRQALAASFEQRWSLWGSGYGGTSQRGGDTATGSADTSTRTYGFAAGADYRPAADWLVGFALAGGNTSWSLSQGLGGGKADVFQIGAFASKAFGAAYVSGALTYAWHGVTTDRTVTVSGFDRLEARYHAHSFGARLEAGYRLLTPWLGVTPYAALQTQSFRTPSYGESATSGSNTFALAYSARTSQTVRTELGSWFDKAFVFGNGDMLTLRSRAAWAHDHANDNGINAAFQTLPGSSFTVNGTAAPTNVALLSLGGEWQRGRITLGARFDGEFAQGSQSYAGTGSVRYAW